MIDISDETKLGDEKDGDEKLKPSPIEEDIEQPNHGAAPPASVGQSEQIKSSRFTAPILRTSPTRPIPVPKPQLKSINNIVQNSKTRTNNNNRIAVKPSSTTVAAASATANSTNGDVVINQVVQKGLIKSPGSVSSPPRELVVIPRQKNSITTNQNCVGSSTKPLVINHGSSVDKTTTSSSSRKEEISVNATASANDLLLSSLVAARQTKSSTLSAQSATSRHSPSTNLPFVGACFGTSISGETNEAPKSDSNPIDITIRQTLTRNKQSLAIQQQATNGPQAVTARLMDLGKRLLEASKQGYTDIVRQLVVNSGAPFTSDWLGTTALHLAAQNGHAEIAEILLRGGVNRDARTKLERTALHLAAQGGNLDVVDLLLIYGSDVNARDMLKMSPLHWAVERGHVCVVEKLLLNGADVQAKSKFQLTPIDIALNSDNYEMMELFKVSHGNLSTSVEDSTSNSKLAILTVDASHNQSWSYKGSSLSAYQSLNQNLSDEHDILGVDYHLSLGDHAGTSRASMLDINEPCIDLVELEWNALKLEPDFFLSNEDEEDESKVEYLMKIVEELQKENKQLRKKVEQLSTTCQ